MYIHIHLHKHTHTHTHKQAVLQQPGVGSVYFGWANAGGLLSDIGSVPDLPNCA